MKADRIDTTVLSDWAQTQVDRIAALERQLKHMTNLYNTAAEADQIRKQEHTSLERQLQATQDNYQRALDKIGELEEKLAKRDKELLECASCGATYWVRDGNFEEAGCPYCECDESQDDSALTQRQLAEARADGERIDWLEYIHTPPHVKVPNVFGSQFLCGWQEDETLRQAIDAARRET